MNLSDKSISGAPVLQFERPLASATEMSNKAHLPETSIHARAGGEVPMPLRVDPRRLAISLKARAKWPWIRSYLQAKEIKPGTGFSALEGLLHANSKGSAHLHETLVAFYQGVFSAGRRYVQIYELSNETFSQLEQSLQSVKVEPSNFSEFYPYVLDEDKLKASTAQLTLCEIKKSNVGDYYLVFCSRRDYTQKEVFEDSAAEAIAKLSPTLYGYSSFIALKKSSFQAFDVLAIRPSLKRIEVFVDLPLAHAQGIDRAQQALKIMKASVDHLPALRQLLQGQYPINVFSAIDAMYRNARGGVLQEIRLRTSTGLLDILRATVDTENLRDTKYHTGGAQAINNEVELYDLTTRLPLTMPAGHVIIRLASTASSLSSSQGNRSLLGFQLDECVSQNDALRAINRIVSFLN